LGLTIAALAVIEFIISSSFQSLNVQSVNNQKKPAHGKTAQVLRRSAKYRSGQDSRDTIWVLKLRIEGLECKTRARIKAAKLGLPSPPTPLPTSGEGSFGAISRDANVESKSMVWN
jgi:hypothetical protein